MEKVIMQFELNTKLSKVFSNTRDFVDYIMQKHEDAEVVPEGQAEAVEKLRLELDEQIAQRAKKKIDEPNMTAALKEMVASMTDEQAVSIFSFKTLSASDLLEKLEEDIRLSNEDDQKTAVLKLPTNFFKAVHLTGCLLPMLEKFKPQGLEVLSTVPSFEAGLENNFSVVRAYRQECPAPILHAKDAYYGYKNAKTNTDKAFFGLRFFFASVIEMPVLFVKSVVVDTLSLVGNLTLDVVGLPGLLSETIRTWSKKSSKVEETNDEPQKAPSPTAKPVPLKQKPSLTPGFEQSAAQNSQKEEDVQQNACDSVPRKAAGL